MQSKNTSRCCSFNCNCEPEDQKTDICRYCKSPGICVKEPILKRFIKAEFIKDLKNSSSSFFLCMNPDCRITYFSNTDNLYFTTEDLRIPIGFKKGATQKIICYCHMITEDMIREAVRAYGLRSFTDIVLKYRKRIRCNCERLNPAGRCCTEHFYAVINDTLRSLGIPEVEVPDSCC